MEALRWLALYAMFRSLSATISDAFKASGHPMILMNVGLYRLALIGGLGIPVLQRYGLIGMCILIVVAYGTALVWELWRVSRLASMPLWPTVGWLAALMTFTLVIMNGGYLLLEWLGGATTIWGVVAGGAVTSAVYVGAVALSDREAVRDLQSLRRPRAVTS